MRGPAGLGAPLQPSWNSTVQGPQCSVDPLAMDVALHMRPAMHPAKLQGPQCSPDCLAMDVALYMSPAMHTVQGYRGPNVV